MSEHRHEWKLQLHLDGCHFYTSTFVCACGASLIQRDERDMADDPWATVWSLEDCERCAELLAGAQPLHSEEIVLPTDKPDPARAMPGWHHRDAGDTERRSAYANMPRKGTQRAQVLEYLRQVGAEGATDNEMHFLAGIGARPHVPGSRRLELVGDGWTIRDSGRRRKTDTGDPAIVWVLDEEDE